MRNLTQKLLDVFVYKYDKKFAKGNFNIGAGTKDLNTSNISGTSNQSFDSALSMIYEDVIF